MFEKQASRADKYSLKDFWPRTFELREIGDTAAGSSTPFSLNNVMIHSLLVVGNRCLRN